MTTNFCTTDCTHNKDGVCSEETITVCDEICMTFVKKGENNEKS